MEDISLMDIRKTWRRHVANTGSIPDAQCYKDYMEKICQALTTAFAPSDDLAMIPSEEEGTRGETSHIRPTTQTWGNAPKFTEIQRPNSDLLAQPPSIDVAQNTEQTTTTQTTKSQDLAIDTEMQRNKSVAIEINPAKTQNVETQDIDEQPVGDSDQPTDKIDEATVTITEATDENKEISEETSADDPASQIAAASNEPTPAAEVKAVSFPFLSTCLKPEFTDLRALYLDLLYHDRFTLLSSETFLLFLSEQPNLSHRFLRYLIHHRFGIRYVHQDGGNANHGITPFRFPFLPVRRDLPLGLYFDNRWALLNDPAWLGWVSTEEFIMAAFWAEMGFRGGLGVMQRRKGLAERMSNFAVSPF